MSDDSLQDVEWGTPEIEEDISNELLKDDFILVKLTSKKLCKYYIAKIVELTNDVLGVKYLKRNIGNKFLCEDHTIYEIQTSDVVMKLPPPYITGGTERRNKELQFSIDFSTYSVE